MSPSISPLSQSLPTAQDEEEGSFALDTAAQVRAARVLLGISQSDLAQAARLSLSTLNDIEHGRESVRSKTHQRVMQCLEEAGVVFVRESAASHGHTLGALLRRKMRPERGGDEVQRWLATDTLVPPKEMLFFLTSESPSHPTNNTLRLAVRLRFPHRMVLLDLAGFDLSLHQVPMLARFLLSAFSLYPEYLFCTQPLLLPTLAMTHAEAYATLAQTPTLPFQDPFPMLDILESAQAQTGAKNNEQNTSTIAEAVQQHDHPLARLRDLVDAQHDT